MPALPVILHVAVRPSTAGSMAALLGVLMRQLCHPRQPASLPALLLLILPLLLAVAAAPTETRIVDGAAAGQQTYLLPILRYGPSNQRRDLRYIMALAKQLGCGVIPQGIYKHYLDRAQRPVMDALQTGVDSRKPQSNAPPENIVMANPATGRHLQQQQQRHMQHMQHHTWWRGDPYDSTGGSTDHMARRNVAVHRQTYVSSDSTADQWEKDSNGLDAGPNLHASHQADGSIGNKQWVRQLYGEAMGLSFAKGLLPGGRSTMSRRSVDKGSLTPGKTVSVQPAGMAGGGSTVPACLRNRVKHYMEPDELFDMQHVSEWLPMTTVQDLRAQGWDGKIDLVLHSMAQGQPPPLNHQKYLHMAFRGVNVSLSSKVTWGYMKENTACGQEEMQQLKGMVAGHRVVAVMAVFLTDWLSVDVSNQTNDRPEGDACQQAVFEANRLLRPSPWLATMAKRFIQQRFGNEKFVAVHVRPYPDECLLEWIKPGPLNETALQEGCHNIRHWTLHHTLATCTMAAMKATGTRHVYVMAHPAIRARITSLFKEAGSVVPTFLEHSTFNSIARCSEASTTFLAMVEDAIAVQSHVFLGTSKSSITESIVLARWSYGYNHNLYLESRIRNCTLDVQNLSKQLL